MQDKIVAPLTILGSGLAGYTLAREFRKLSPDTPLRIITADAGPFYSKPMLSNALAGGKTPESLANFTSEQMAGQLKAEILTHTRVERIDAGRHRLETGAGSVEYARLVLGLGADPIHIPVAGGAAGDVLSINDLEDYTRFRKVLRDGAHVTLMGAGLIGCEFANDLLATGHPVSVVDPAPLPLGRLLPEAAGASMRDALVKLGIVWHLGTVVERVEHADGRYRVTLGDGTELTTDLVLSAVGLRPRTRLAETAGLKVNRGIVVDRLLRTSDPDVFALGDCAEVNNLVLPFVMPIMHAARALAKTLSETPTPVTYPAMPVVVKTPAWPTVVAPPPPNAVGEWRVEPTGQGLKALFRNDAGELLGFVLCGDTLGEKMALTRQLPAWLA